MGNNKSRINHTGTSSLQTDLQLQLEAEHQVAALAHMKERRRRDMLQFEEELNTQMALETQLTYSAKQQQGKLLQHVTESQQELERNLADVRQKQEQARQQLTEDLNQAELKLHDAINGLLQTTNHESERIRNKLKQEGDLLEKLLLSKANESITLQKETILAVMEKELSESFRNAQNKKISVAASLIPPQDDLVNEILHNRQKGQAELVAKLANEEMLQQQAFASLLTQRDMLSQQLQSNITSVVAKLNQLTSLEVRRQQEKFVSSTIALSEMRVQLAELLSKLLLEQENRAQDLRRLLQQMESQREHEARDFWLLQYQRLMDSMPPLATNVKAQEPSAPPLFVDPSAPLADDPWEVPVPSAPGPDLVFVETACVICLDNRCQIIFLPCGHLCCCQSCYDGVVLCPLCRAEVAQKLHINS